MITDNNQSGAGNNSTDPAPPKAAKTIRDTIRVVASKHKKYPWELVGPKRFAPPGKDRLRRYYKTKTEAIADCDRIRKEVESVGAEMASMPIQLRVDAYNAWRLIGHIEGASLERAARQFLDLHEELNRAVTLETLVAEKLASMSSKKRNPVKANTVTTMAARLEALLEAFPPGTNCAMIRTAQLEDAIDKLPSLAALAQDKRVINTAKTTGCPGIRGRRTPVFAPKTIKLYMADWSGAFRFGLKQGYLIKNPMAPIDAPQVHLGAIAILSPLEMQALLNWARQCAPDLLAYFAIGAFAGVRRAELMRLDWSSVDLAARGIDIDASISKTASRRKVKICDNLAAWLALCHKPSGPVVNVKEASIDSTFRKILCAHAGILKWPRNGLRHSFGSYHLELHRNVFETMLEMGHTTRTMLDKHYRQLVSHPAAVDYFAIYPLGHPLAKIPLTLVSQAPLKQDAKPLQLVIP
jgi:integrase